MPVSPVCLLTAACVKPTRADPPVYILLAFTPKSPPELNSHCFAHYIFQYKNLFGTNTSFGIPYKQSLYEIFEIFVYHKAD